MLVLAVPMPVPLSWLESWGLTEATLREQERVRNVSFLYKYEEYCVTSTMSGGPPLLAWDWTCGTFQSPTQNFL